MTVFRERYRPQFVAVDESYKINGGHLAGFLCKTSGTLTLTQGDGKVLVSAHPVSAGLYIPMPFSFDTPLGATAQLAGGASGTLVI